MAARAAARAKKAEEYLLGKEWNEEHVEEAAKILEEEFTPLSDMRASAWYRKTVAANLLRGFYVESLNDFAPQREYRPSATIQGLVQ